METPKAAPQANGQTAIPLKPDSSSGGTTVAERNRSKKSSPVTQVSEVLPPRTVPLFASPLDRASDAELKRFPGARVTASVEVAGPGPNQNTRVRILSTDFKYPNIRVEEVIDPSSGQVLSREEMVADHVLVTLREGEDPASLLDHLNLPHATLESISPDPSVSLYRLQLPAATLDAVPAALASLDKTTGAVISVEPDFIRQGLLSPNDPQYLNGTLWGLNQGNDADIDAPEAWEVRTSALGITVAVIDTGVRYTHQDLAANAWTNAGEVAGDQIDNDGNGYVDDVRGIDAYNRDGDPMDDQGHGTHCAGTIGATGNNGIGLTGVAWGVRLMALKFLSSTGSGTDSDAVICIDYARLKGAKILSCSWGGGGAGTSLQAAIERARNAGVLMVAAAGNESNNNDLNPSYPASYPHDNIVSVAATTSADGLASFSNFGATSVDLGAPGSGIYSTVSTSDSAYATYSGTSMATPHVSGALALLAAQYSADSHTALISRLLNGTDPIASLSGKAKAGRLNLAKALVSTNTPPVLRPANDNFIASTAVTGTSWARTGTTVNATAEAGEPAHAGQAPGSSVWYTWTAPASGPATISSAGSAFDTVLAVYIGSALGGLTEVAANDNPPSGGTAAAVSFPAVAGTVYRIAVDGKGGASGAISLTGNIAGTSPANDAFTNAISALGSSFSLSGSNVGATREAREPNHASVSGGKSVWWRWTAPATGSLVLATAGSAYDTVLAVHTGDRVDRLRLVVANDDVSSADTSSRVSFAVKAGVTYRVAVDGYQGAAGTIQLGGVFTAKIPLGAPTNVQASSSGGVVKGSWTPVSGASFYEATVRSAARTYAVQRTMGTSMGVRVRAQPSESLVISVRAFDADLEPGIPSPDQPVSRAR